MHESCAAHSDRLVEIWSNQQTCSTWTLGPRHPPKFHPPNCITDIFPRPGSTSVRSAGRPSSSPSVVNLQSLVWMSSIPFLASLQGSTEIDAREPPANGFPKCFLVFPGDWILENHELEVFDESTWNFKDCSIQHSRGTCCRASAVASQTELDCFQKMFPRLSSFVESDSLPPPNSIGPSHPFRPGWA